MGTILVLAAGIVGFASAIGSLIFFDAGFLTALAIWSTTGIVAIAVAIAIALVPRPSRHDSVTPEIA